MTPAASPRHFSPATFIGFGAPAAAHRALDSLRLTFLQALQSEPGVDWLRHQVLRAEDPADLWLLRGAVFDTLTGTREEQRCRRQLLRRGLDSIFPDLDPASGFTPL